MLELPKFTIQNSFIQNTRRLFIFAKPVLLVLLKLVLPNLFLSKLVMILPNTTKYAKKNCKRCTLSRGFMQLQI